MDYTYQKYSRRRAYPEKILNLKSIGFGAEMWTEEMRQELQKRFNAPAYNIYGLTEIMDRE
jgi:phenylacetate-CoA ligase